MSNTQKYRSSFDAGTVLSLTEEEAALKNQGAGYLAWVPVSGPKKSDDTPADSGTTATDNGSGTAATGKVTN